MRVTALCSSGFTTIHSSLGKAPSSEHVWQLCCCCAMEHPRQAAFHGGAGDPQSSSRKHTWSLQQSLSLCVCLGLVLLFYSQNALLGLSTLKTDARGSGEGQGGLFSSYFYVLPWSSAKGWWMIMQVLLQLVCVVSQSSTASVSGISPKVGFSPHLACSNRSAMARQLFGSHLLNVVTEQLELLCGRERKRCWEGAEASHPGRRAPSLWSPMEGVRILPYLHPSCRWSPASSGSRCRASCSGQMPACCG